MLAGVVPAASASDHLLVSRATRKILSPFGQGGMYSSWAYVPPKRLCSTTRLCSTLMFQGGLCSTGLCSRLGLMFHRPGLCSTERPGESSQMPAVAPPGETASDLFPVSRATRKILSPFGVPPMYSAYAQGESLCPGGGLMPKEVLMPKKRAEDFAGAPEGLCPRGGLCPTKRPANRPRCLRLLHQERPRPICSPFLARHGKSSALLAFP